MIVLKEVANNPFLLALSLKSESQSEGVEDAPCESVDEGERELYVDTGDGKSNAEDRVDG